MPNTITMEMLHEDLESLKRDFAELRSILLEPTLRKEVAILIQEARKRMKTKYVSNEDIKKEFGV